MEKVDFVNEDLFKKIESLEAKLKTAHEVMAKANIAIGAERDWPKAFGILNEYLCGLQSPHVPDTK